MVAKETTMDTSKINLLTVAEAAEESGMNQETLSSRVRTGSLRSFRRNSRVYLIMQDIIEWQPVWHNNPLEIIQEAHAAGESDVSIATMLGVSRERVRKLRSSLGLPRNPRKPQLSKVFTADQPRQVLEINRAY